MKKGYTLAEVLITLGIIGIVAAITIPNVVKSYQKKTAAVRLKQVYSIISQALYNAQADSGDVNIWGANYYGLERNADNTNDIIIAFADNYFLPYLKSASVYYNSTLKQVGYNTDIIETIRYTCLV